MTVSIFFFFICKIASEHLFFGFQARPFFSDRRKFIQLVDPLLQGNFPLRCLHQAIAITAMCLQEQPKVRPLIGDIVVALEYLASQSIPEVHRHGMHNPPSQPYSEMARN